MGICGGMQQDWGNDALRFLPQETAKKNWDMKKGILSPHGALCQEPLPGVL